jgi:hypothetical protein
MNDTAVDTSRCYVSGCPCFGSCSSDTSSDNKKWYCPTHFKRPSSTHAQITFELNRMSWLVGIIESVRNAYKNDGWDHKAANYHFSQNMRNDLRMLTNEATGAYCRRLESELRKCCLIDDRNGQNDLNSAG